MNREIGFTSEESLVKSVRNVWDSQYRNQYRNWPEKKEIYDKLKDVTDIDEIESIIGNKSWTRIGCDVCDANNLKKAAIVMGYDEWIKVCVNCLKKTIGELE